MSVLVKGWSIPTDGCCGCYFRTGKYCGILSKNERVLEYAERFTRPDNCPLVYEEPVKRGMWTFIRLTDKDYGHKAKECSSCGSTFFDTKKWNYCPNCGADMRGEE